MGLYQKLFLYSSALALLAQCEVDITQDKKKMTKLHKKMDIDRDGKLSHNEVIEYHKLTLKDMAAQRTALTLEHSDSNKDGKLSYTEFMASFSEDSEEEAKELEKIKFEAADLNKDGSLDESEIGHMEGSSPHVIEALASASIKRNDQDGDGKLDFWEWSEQDSLGEEWEQARLQGLDVAMKSVFAELDVDGDGKLTAEELYRYESGEYHTHSMFKEMFAGADTDEDSHLSLDEFHKHMPLMKESGVAQWMQHLEL